MGDAPQSHAGNAAGHGLGFGHGHASDTESAPLGRRTSPEASDTGLKEKNRSADDDVGDTVGAADDTGPQSPGSKWGFRSAGSASSAWEQV